jgi:adenylylsulfate kinase|tara:strand:+ start:304 stop:777 length:474 start_codon:yes stop_codon:yes gene_type:complete
MVYWFTGQPSAGKTTLGSKLHNFLKTEKRNWRRDVFHLDGDDLRLLTINKDYSEEGRRNNIRNAQMIAEFLHNNGCDVVVSLVAPYRDLREEFKERIGFESFQEIFLHTTEKRERDHFHTKDYQPPQSEFVDVDTTKDSPKITFSKLINHLTKLKKI